MGEGDGGVGRGAARRDRVVAGDELLVCGRHGFDAVNRIEGQQSGKHASRHLPALAL